jgi:hypothetical protein
MSFALNPQDILIATERLLIRNAKENHENVKKAIKAEDLSKNKAKKRIKRLQYQLKQKEKKHPTTAFPDLRIQISNLKRYHVAAPSLHEQARMSSGLSIREQEKQRREEEKREMDQVESQYVADLRKKTDLLPSYLKSIEEILKEDISKVNFLHPSTSKEETSEEHTSVKSLGTWMTQTLQYRWWVKASQVADLFARECEKAECKIPMQLVHALMNSFGKFNRETEVNDEHWLKKPEWKALVEKGYEHAVKLTQELRQALYDENNLVLPWFAIIHFMLKPLLLNRPVNLKEFETHCRNYILSEFPRMEELEIVRCCHFSKCRYVELYDGLEWRYKKMKKRLKELYRPPMRGLLEPLQGIEGKRPTLMESTPLATQTFHERFMYNLKHNYTSCNSEFVDEKSNKIIQIPASKDQKREAELKEREKLLEEDSLFLFVVLIVFGYNIK